MSIYCRSVTCPPISNFPKLTILLKRQQTQKSQVNYQGPVSSGYHGTVNQVMLALETGNNCFPHIWDMCVTNGQKHGLFLLKHYR